MLRNRGLWQRIDEVVWAEEGNPDSAGGKLAEQYGVEIAPFFLVEKEGEVVLYKSAIKFMKELVKAEGTATTQKDQLPIFSASSLRLSTNPPAMAGIDIRKENSAAFSALTPLTRPAAILDPLREIPGKMANA